MPRYLNSATGGYYEPDDLLGDNTELDWYDADFADEMYKRYRLNEPPFTNNFGVY